MRARPSQTGQFWYLCDQFWGLDVPFCRAHCVRDQRRRINRFLGAEGRHAPGHKDNVGDVAPTS